MADDLTFVGRTTTIIYLFNFNFLMLGTLTYTQSYISFSTFLSLHKKCDFVFLLKTSSVSPGVRYISTAAASQTLD